MMTGPLSRLILILYPRLPNRIQLCIGVKRMVAGSFILVLWRPSLQKYLHHYHTYTLTLFASRHLAVSVRLTYNRRRKVHSQS